MAASLRQASAENYSLTAEIFQARAEVAHLTRVSERARESTVDLGRYPLMCARSCRVYDVCMCVVGVTRVIEMCSLMGSSRGGNTACAVIIGEGFSCYVVYKFMIAISSYFFIPPCSM